MNSTLLESFRKTKYRLAGHGPRNVSVLKEAFSNIDGDVESDIYGKGAVIEKFEQKMAGFLGKESAVFFPSGTMAQQIALRIWCDRTGRFKVAYHPLCHLEIHEEEGLKKLHNIETVLLAEPDRVIDLYDVKNMPEDVTCLLLELPQREIGGQLPSFETLRAISDYCRQKDIRLHLDGARLYEVLPYYGKSAAEVCALFDSVYVSLYKGIGGIAGAILAGGKDFTEEAKVWKRRHGGDLISLYPYILSADYYFEERVSRMGEYYEGARELARLFNQCTGVSTLPEVPVSNMFHVHFAFGKDTVEWALVTVHEQTSVGFTGNLREKEPGLYTFELSVGDELSRIPKQIVENAFVALQSQLEQETTAAGQEGRK